MHVNDVTNALSPQSGRAVPKWLAYACAFALSFSSVAHADVIEISATGEVTRISAPAPAGPSGALPHPSDALAMSMQSASTQTALNPQLIEAIAWVESHFNQSARSPAGAIGIMQLMPDTAASLSVDASDTSQNIHGGAAYLRAMLNEFDGDLELALAAYNAGPEAVRRYGGVPPYPETQNYVASVLGYLAQATEDSQ